MQKMLVVFLLICAVDVHQSVPTRQRSLHKRSDTNSCPDLGTPSNGYRKPQESNHSIGAQVRFGCNTGYLLQGSEELTCSYDSESGETSWSSDMPQCIAASAPHHYSYQFCGPPPDPTAHAHIFALSPGVQVQYVCSEDYVPSQGDEVLVCTNGRWTGTTGIPFACKREKCFDLGRITNGVRILSGTQEGDKVAFRCNEGYSLLGSRQLVCGPDKEWNGTWPQCIREPSQCGDPGVPLHGSRAVHGTTEGKRVQYFCDEGYRLEGDVERTCLSTGEWWGDVPICVELDCGPPQSVTNGNVSYDSTVFGSQANYSCKHGYFVMGYTISVCSDGARWSPPPPTCKVVRCPRLKVPFKGRVKVSGYPSFGMVASYSCNPGYGLMGVPVRTCQGDGTWSASIPSCQKGSCGTLPDPENGMVRFTSILLGGHATFVCNQGYILDGNYLRTCGVLGTWSDSSPTCRPIQCPSLRRPDSGSVVMTNSNLFQSIANYSCNFGYRLFGSESRECQSTGLWTGRPPGCFGIRCAALEAPHNGEVESDDTIIGSEAYYSCKPGYQLQFGDMIRTCMAEVNRQVWTGTPPCCIGNEIMCPNLTSPGNGLVEFETRIGDTAQYSCDTGLFLVGKEQRVCQADGNWSGEEPECGTPCPNLSDPENGTVSQNGRVPGSEACYTCRPGFVASSSSDCRVCMINGEWNGTEVTCTFVSDPSNCGPLPDPTNGMVDTGNGTLNGARAFYTCDTGYELSGESLRTCGSDGEWTGSELECNLINCGVLLNPDNGNVDLSDGTVFDSVALYTCQQLFVLEGNANRTCLNSGAWSGEDPVCSELRCEDLVAPANTTITFSNQNFINSNAVYSCNSGFDLVDGPVRTCTVSGWTPPEPICRELRCRNLTDPENGTVTTDRQTVGGVATYSCEEGFMLSDNLTERVCMGDESWSGMDPSCILIICPALPDPMDGSVDVLDNTPGGMAIYSCDAGFDLVGEDSRVCGSDGAWEGVIPDCEAIVFCPELTDPENGMVDVRGRTVGSQAIYDCDVGFAESGPVVRRCGEDGEWEGPETGCVDITTIWCPMLLDPIDGRVNVLGHAFREVAQYSCDTGFSIVGDTFRTCTVTSEWSGVMPTCQPDNGTISCPVLSAPDGGEIDIVSIAVGAEVMYSCNPGRTLDGPSERVCQVDGTWTDQDPVCNPVDCGTLDDPDNGVVVLNGGTTSGSIANYGCDTGFVLDGPSLRVCQFNGMWTEMAPTCRAIDCGPLSDPENGVVDTSGGTLFEDTANYTCSRGFELSGVSSRVCTMLEVWSDSEPTCEVVMCPVLSNPANGLVVLSNGNYVDSIAGYSCVSGFRIRPGDPIVRTCLQSGQWSGTEPQCIPNSRAPIRCPDLSDPTYGAVEIEGEGEGSVTTYTCDQGFRLNGEETLECLADGKWSSPVPTCEKIQCPDPGMPRNGRRVLGEFTEGSRVYFVPRDGFETQDETVLLCQGTGNWSSATPQFSASIETSHLSASLVSCISGYEIDGFGRLCKCSANGSLQDCCRYRRNWSSLTKFERERYISAVLTVSSDPTYKPLYQTLIAKYQTSFSTIAQSTIPEISQFIPWHRYFLFEYEDLLRLVHRDITIPYWDWSVFTSDPYSSPVFGTTAGFGDTADPQTGCVTSGPFREGQFEVTSFLNGSSGCLTREYNEYQFFERGLLEDALTLGVDMFRTFHNFVQLFLSLNIRCFVGGEMCTTNAASDPLLLLHLARIDLFVQKWQERDKLNEVVQRSNKADRLVLTLDPALTVADFCSNDQLPYGACVKYAPLDPVGSGPEGSGAVLADRCMPQEKLEEGAGMSLSEEAKQYMATTCNNM